MNDSTPPPAPDAAPNTPPNTPPNTVLLLAEELAPLPVPPAPAVNDRSMVGRFLLALGMPIVGLVVLVAAGIRSSAWVEAPPVPLPDPPQGRPAVTPAPVVEIPPVEAPAEPPRVTTEGPAHAEQRVARPAGEGSTSELLAEWGWQRVETDPEAALGLFDMVVEAAPKAGDGYYGRGYALLALGRGDEALRALCTARRLGTAEVVREVSAVLTKNELQCP